MNIIIIFIALCTVILTSTEKNINNHVENTTPESTTTTRFTETTPEETSSSEETSCYETQIVHKILIEWKNSINGGTLYYSTPLCVDEFGKPVIRVCSDGHFVNQTPPKCNIIQRNDYACLEHLHLVTINRITFCYEISQNKMAPYNQFSCSYKQVDATDNTDYYMLLSHMFSVWLPYHRQDSGASIGYFVPDGFYGNVYEPWITVSDPSNTTQFKEHKCLSVHQGIISGDCYKQNYHVCVYRAISLNYTEEMLASRKEANFCKVMTGSDLCRVSWKRNSLVCVCPQPLTNCKMPAVYPTASKGCAVGVEIVNNGIQWLASRRFVRNTLWSASDLPPYLQVGQYITSSDTGWVMVKHADCMMCEETFDFNEPEVLLEYNLKTQEIVFDVVNPQRAFNVNSIVSGERYQEKCFTEDASSVTDVINLKTMNSPGIWQCEVIDMADTYRKLTSNSVELNFGRYIYTIQFVADKYNKNQLEIIKILDVIFKHYYDFHAIYWIEVKDAHNSWIEVLYRFNVILNSNKVYKEKYEVLNDALSVETLTYLKPRVYNLEYCDQFTVTQQGHELHWPRAEVNEESSTDCFDESANRIRIKCLANFTFGARFSPIPECFAFSVNVSDQLSDLENSDAPSDEILSDLSTILTENSEFTTEDFNKTANILEKLQQTSDVKDVMTVVNAFMSLPLKAINQSQIIANVTDRILYSLDVVLKTTEIDNSDEFIVKDNIESLLLDTKQSRLSGFAYLTNGSMKYLQIGLSISDIVKINKLESAVYVNNENSLGLASMTMFKTPVLFNEFLINNYDTYHRVFGVLLPENNQKSNQHDFEVIMVFPRNKSTETSCVYWMYGDNTHGFWKKENNILIFDNYTVCVYNHTTHYGQLIMLRSPLDPISDQILSTMTAIECALSTFGLCVIVITAILFPAWRQNKTRLLQYCFVLLLQTILLFVNTNIELESWSCILAGALLQFTVLSQFCWMVVIALHQHQTLVVVYHTKTWFWDSKKVMLFTYGMPLMILVSALAVDVESFAQQGTGLGLSVCYPSGQVFLFSLLIPTSIIAAVNGCLFIWMLYKLTCGSMLSGTSRVKIPGGANACCSLDKIRTLALMVFTLGITWWLGFAALLFDNCVLLYLFSITTGMQGFLIFLANILFKKEVRSMYCRKYKIWFVNRK